MLHHSVSYPVYYDLWDTSTSNYQFSGNTGQKVNILFVQSNFLLAANYFETQTNKHVPSLGQSQRDSKGEISRHLGWHIYYFVHIMATKWQESKTCSAKM
jgi:hypothetical protein